MPQSFFLSNASRLKAYWSRAYAEKAFSLRVAYGKARLLPEIVHWREPALPLVEKVEVHLLTCQRDWLCAAWVLASFIYFSRRRWPIFVHDDGSLEEAAKAQLTTMFSTLKIVGRREADAAMDDLLAAHPRCRTYRKEHALALKLFDCVLLSQTARLIVLDSDLLFFQRPEEVLEWVRNESHGCFFNPDFQDAYCLTREQALAHFGVELWPRVNTGLSLLPRAALDLDFCERCLGDDVLLDPEAITWREQTLYALCASRFGQGGLLSGRYEVNFNHRMAEDSITRHYVGDMRPWFYAEGLSRVRPALFP